MSFRCLCLDNDTEKLDYLDDLLGGIATIDSYSDPRLAIEQVKKSQYDFIVVDLNMPIMNGLDFIETIRFNDLVGKTKIFILSTMQDTETKVRGLSLKISDYLSFDMTDEEIVLRITNHLTTNENIEKFKNLSLDTYQSILKKGESQIDLTPLELRILRYLFTKKGNIENFSIFTDKIWSEKIVSRQTVNTHLYNLNKKLDPFEYRFVRTRNRGASLQVC